MSALFGPWEDMAEIRTLDDILDHFSVAERIWRAFEVQVGSPGSDLRLLAALPKVALITGCGHAQTDRGKLHPDTGDSGGFGVAAGQESSSYAVWGG